MNWTRVFPTNLQHCRRRRGWSQLQLAKRLGVDRSLVTRWERGEREPGMGQLLSLSLALGVPVSSFITGRESLSAGRGAVWTELAHRGAPFLAELSEPLLAIRPAYDSISDALVQPEPRVIDYLPGWLLSEDVPPRSLWGRCADLGVESRLGWLVDVALQLAGEGVVAVPPARVRALQTVLSLIARPSPDDPEDGLGFPAEASAERPPVFRRWRVSYAGRLDAFRQAALELSEATRR